ncbi:MAG: carbohydrate kinase family protein [Firmicutes bacterium]|nr:carbohydrate kinase family protein [Bacillota bacterium]
MAELVGIGAAVFDTVLTIDSFPQEDTKLQAAESLVQGGGPCATALVTASRLGIAAEFIGIVGDDYCGRYILADFKRFGVGTAHIIVKEGCRSFHSVVLLNLFTGSRTCIWHKGTVPSISSDGIPLSAIRKAKVLHLDGHQLEGALSAARCAKEAGVKVCLDAGSICPGIEKLLPLVDFLIPSEEFALKFTNMQDAEQAAASLYAEYKPEVVVVTQGSRGGLIYNGSKLHRYPAFEVNVIDSNGAGDVFHGAFIAGYLKGMSHEEAAEFASAVSAIKCMSLGARESIPSYKETVAFLKERRS